MSVSAKNWGAGTLEPDSERETVIAWDLERQSSTVDIPRLSSFSDRPFKAVLLISWLLIVLQVITDQEMEKNLNITGKFVVGAQHVKKPDAPTYGPGAEARLRLSEGSAKNFVQPVAEGRMRLQENRYYR